MRSVRHGVRVLVALTLLLPAVCFAQTPSFYDPARIQDVRITLAEQDWRHRLDTAKSGFESYLIAKNVEINGEAFTRVGVKFKGASSYSPANAKNSIHLELNNLRRGQDYQGFTDIKLNNAYLDPSFVREVLAYDILGSYTDAPRANFARVWINGAYQGLFVNVEAVNKRFLRSRFGSSDDAFFKCVPPPPGVKRQSTLVWQGADSTAYADRMEMHSKQGWTQLLWLIGALASPSERIERILDVDRTLWMHAFNNVVVNLDSYSGGSAHNYYLFRDTDGRFLPIPWDMNTAFGTYAETQPGTTLTQPQLRRLPVLLHAESRNRPLISRLLSNPMYRRMYVAHVRTILEEQFADGVFRARAQAWTKRIAAEVPRDPNKFYSTANFRTALTADLGDGARLIPGVVSFMEERAQWLASAPELRAAPPALANCSMRAERRDGALQAVATASAPHATAVLLCSRAGTKRPFAPVLMHDDGTNGDAKAGDGIFTVRIPVSAGIVQYYVYAENADAGAFAPARAEHEYLTFEAKP